MDKFDICGFGRDVFGRFDKNLIKIDQLRSEIEAVQEQFISNDWSVLYCFCEKSLETTLMLTELEMRWDIPKNLQMSGTHFLQIILLQSVKLAIERNNYFNTTKFTEQVKEVWMQMIGVQGWLEMKDSAEKVLTKLPFFQTEFDILFQ